MISFGFGLKCILESLKKKKKQQKKGSSLTGILYKICRKIQQQQNPKILHRYLKKHFFFSEIQGKAASL